MVKRPRPWSESVWRVVKLARHLFGALDRVVERIFLAGFKQAPIVMWTRRSAEVDIYVRQNHGVIERPRPMLLSLWFLGWVLLSACIMAVLGRSLGQASVYVYVGYELFSYAVWMLLTRSNMHIQNKAIAVFIGTLCLTYVMPNIFVFVLSLHPSRSADIAQSSLMALFLFHTVMWLFMTLWRMDYNCSGSWFWVI